MICPTCDSPNAQGARECAACGALLPRAGHVDEAPPSIVEWQPLDALPDLNAGESDALPFGSVLQGGAFQIERVLGQGGFGITYAARDARLDRSVAIKEFLPVGCSRRDGIVGVGRAFDPDDYVAARQRFLEEAKILARFKHPGIVEVHGVFEENNSAYMVMERLHGQTLGQIVTNSGGRPLPSALAVGYIERATDALQALHSARLLHRDIKPENIVVCDAHGGIERVVLIDFGSAREFAHDGTKRMTATVTPGYAPLEQYGQRARYGAYTDIYALSATLYHLLTGSPPPGAIDRAAGVDLQAPHLLNPAVNRTLSDAIVWGLEMKVDARPQNASEWLQALRSGRPDARAANTALSHYPDHAPWPPPTPYEDPDDTMRPMPPKQIRDLVRRLDSTTAEVQSISCAPVEREGRTFYEVGIVASDVQRVVWPHWCACCGVPTHRTFALRVEDVFCSIPLCDHCHQHAARARSFEPTRSSRLGILSVWGMGAIALSVPILHVAHPLLMVPFTIWISNGLGRRYAKQQARELTKTECRGVGFPVSYDGRNFWDGAHVFSFVNALYAEEFARLNDPKNIATP